MERSGSGASGERYTRSAGGKTCSLLNEWKEKRGEQGFGVESGFPTIGSRVREMGIGGRRVELRKGE